MLNAHEVATEAEIVAEAGQPGKVTVATNMAGRGTDIKLGPGVAETGGLHVICTELHDSARIDRQLMGRCGRQGDPGTVRQYMSLDDDVIRTGFGPDTADRLTTAGETGERHPAALFGPLAAGSTQSRAPPPARPHHPAAPRKRAQENAAGNGAGPLSRHAGLAFLLPSPLAGEGLGERGCPPMFHPARDSLPLAR